MAERNQDVLVQEHEAGNAFIRAFLSVHNVVFEKLQGLISNIKWSKSEVTDLFIALLKRFESTKPTDLSRLQPFLMGMLHCIEINFITPTWKVPGSSARSGMMLLELVQDVTLTDESLKTYLSEDKEKTLDEILEEIRQEELNQVDEQLLRDVKDIVSSVDEVLVSGKEGSHLSGLKKDLLLVCRAAEKTYYRPRLTQMVSWCVLVLSRTSRLIQVGTGEGKSCIVAMFAAYRAMKNENVDVMSSSSVLAERDINEWKEFYKALKITVSCNTNKLPGTFNECYRSQVVYGTVEEFAGDWLRQNFSRMDIFGQRKFQCAIVDEADSLMLDKGDHTVYISSDMPALQHLNPLLALIWKITNQFRRIDKNTTLGPKKPFFQVILENISKAALVDEFTILQIAEDQGLLARGSLRDLRKDLNLYTQKAQGISISQLADFIRKAEARFPHCSFGLYCLNDRGGLEKLNSRPLQDEARRQRVRLVVTKGGFCQYIYSDTESAVRAAEAEVKQLLHFTPCDLTHDKISCFVPNFLSDLVESKLKTWIGSAFRAHTLTNDHDYVIERHGIVPVDFSCTGVVQNFMRWTDGLQQFVEMKHGAKLSDMAAITNYMSNVGLLQMYGDQIYGLSGTLGGKAETETLQKIYEGVKTCQIPSFKRRKLFEAEGLVVDDEEEWIETICDVVTTQTKPNLYRGARAVLVICETIKRAKQLHSCLNVSKKKLYISNNIDNSNILAEELDSGEVLIATNLAGRGTDLGVTEQVKAAGGLFVVQNFLPKNARVEAQAFGRTARQGSPGSAQLILCSSHFSEPLQLLMLLKNLLSLIENLIDITLCGQKLLLLLLRLYQADHQEQIVQAMSAILLFILKDDSNSGLKIAKEVRDNAVARDLADYLKSGVIKMKKKGELFCQYLETLNALYESSNNEPAEADLSALNEFWGMWLLTTFSEEASLTELRSKLSADLQSAVQKLRKRESPSGNPYHYTLFGNDLRKKGRLVESVSMYTKAIQLDPQWAAIAYYNRAFTSLLQQNKQQDPNCLLQALEDLQNARNSVELQCELLKLTHRYSTEPIQQQHGDTTARFESHIKDRERVLHLFKANITKNTDKLQQASDRGGTVSVEKRNVHFLLTLWELHLSKLLVLSIQAGMAIRKANTDPLSLHELVNDPALDIINEVSSLTSLGLTKIYELDTHFRLAGFLSKTFRRIRGFFSGGKRGSLRK